MDDKAKNPEKMIPFQDDESEKSQVKKKRRPRKRSKESGSSERRSEVFKGKIEPQKSPEPFVAPGGFDQPAGGFDQPAGGFDQPVDLPADKPVGAEQPDTQFPAFGAEQPVGVEAVIKDPVHKNVADKEEEDRYKEEVESGSKPEDVKSEKKESVKEQPSPFMTEESAQPFSAPTIPQVPSTLDSKALNEKPMDNIGQTSSMPRESIEDKDKDVENMIEDKEKDENTDVSSDDNLIGSEEGAIKEYEQNDPLTTGPAEAISDSLQDSVPDAQVGGEVSVADVTSGIDGSEDGLAEDKPGFWDMLEDAGIQKRQVVILASVVGGVIAIALFFILGGYKLFTGSDDPSVKKPSVEEPTQEPARENPSGDSDDDMVVDPDLDQHFALSGLVNSYIFGLEFSSQRVLPGLNLNPVSYGGSTAAVDASLIAGQNPGVSKEAISYYIDLIRRINNVINIDVYNHLNQYVDRRAALQEHLALLNSLLLEAESSKNVVIQDLNSLDVEYDATSLRKDEYETKFFDSMGGYNGDTAYDYLELFVEASQLRVKQKAYFNALNTVDGSLDAAISSLIPRIQDISVNAEALIKGVRVFEITGSNIDAIILQQ